MPIVPRYQRQVETRPLAGVQLSPSAPEAAFQQPAPFPDLTGVQKVIEEERLKADQVAVLEADNKMAEKSVELERLALGRRGKDAMGATAEIRDEWDKAASELEPELTSDRAKMMFRQRVLSRWSSLHATSEAHAASEGQKFDVEQTTEALTKRHDDALAHFQDPARVAAALGESDAILRDFGKRQGLSDEIVDQKIATAHSAVHVGIISRMLDNGQDQAAEKYYRDHETEVSGEKRGDVEKALEVGSTLGKAQRNVDDILYGAKPASSRRDAYERARAITDPKERQATEQHLDTEFARRDRDERDRYDDLLQQATAYVDDGKLPPPTVMAQLKLGHQQQIKNALKRAAAGKLPQTDLATYSELMTQAGAADPKERQKFIDRNLIDVLDHLSAADFKKFTDLQVKLRKGEATPPEVKGFISSSAMLKSAIKGTKLKEGTPDYLDLVEKVNEAVQHELEGSGKKALSGQQTQEIVDRLVKSHFYVDEFGPDHAYRGSQLGQLDADQRGRLYVPIADVPASEVEAMKKRARDLGLPEPTERQIERGWAAALQGNLGGLDRALRGER